MKIGRRTSLHARGEIYLGFKREVREASEKRGQFKKEKEGNKTGSERKNGREEK